MDENDKKRESGNPDGVDLSELQDFSFGTDWSRTKTESGKGPGVGARRSRPQREGPPSRDRRPPAGRGDRRPPSQDREPGKQAFAGDTRPRRSRSRPQPHAEPVDLPYEVGFYPEDVGFGALIRAMKASCRTYELFEITRLILEKPERFVVGVRRKGDGAGATKEGLLHISVPDSVPFETEEEAVQHVMAHHVEQFFEVEEVETEPPKGNFAFISRCPHTGEFIAPPNYHRYTELVSRHHAAHVPHLPLDQFKARLENVKDEEAIAQWLESMKKVTRYRLKTGEGSEKPEFDALEDARIHLLTHVRDRVCRQSGHTRFSGRSLRTMAPSLLKQHIEYNLERQKRFPLETANALRGRLRRQHFSIYKKGSKGISYVSAVKRKFRRPGQVFSDTVQKLITFIERHPNIHVAELPVKFLGLEETKNDAKREESEAEKRMLIDLRWLLAEGYVIEFSDGRLQAPLPLQEPVKQEEAKPEEALRSHGKTDAKNQTTDEAAAIEPKSDALPESDKSEMPGGDAQSSDEADASGDRGESTQPEDSDGEAGAPDKPAVSSSPSDPKSEDTAEPDNLSETEEASPPETAPEESPDLPAESESEDDSEELDAKSVKTPGDSGSRSL